MVLIKNLSSSPFENARERPTLKKISKDGSLGRARTAELYKMFYSSGPGNGTMLSLPFDQLVEHGIGHHLNWENSAESEYVIRLANEGCFSAIALSIGQAEKYQTQIKPDLPLIVKVDGHLSIGDEVSNNRQSMMSSIERAVQAGANAIGFTFYVGGKDTQEDMERVSRIVEESHKYGKPTFMWAYARGPLPKKMGEDSLYWCSQGVSLAESLGVDVVKQKFPMPLKNTDSHPNIIDAYHGGLAVFSKSMPNVLQLMELEPEGKECPYDLHVRRASFLGKVAPRTLVIVSGGPTSTDPTKVVNTLEMVMDAGLEGQIVGRNLWGIPIPQALELNERLVKVMRKDVYRREW